jgi:hypothetical protein
MSDQFQHFAFQKGIVQIIRSLRMRQIRCMFAVFFLGVLCSSEHAQPPAQQPAADKAIFHLNGAKNSPPVKIVRLMLGQTEIPLDSPVRVEGTWMPKISIVVQNVSPKTIVKAEIMIWFPETRAGTNGPVHPSG